MPVIFGSAAFDFSQMQEEDFSEIGSGKLLNSLMNSDSSKSYVSTRL